MANNTDKIWSKEEMIQNADNWSLAGDVALLNTMKAFSDKLLADTTNISGRIDNLLNGLSEVGLKLDISRNNFQSLRNIQFIENRVYEDDETIKEAENKIEDVGLTEEEKDAILKDAVMKGLSVMDRYFDKVEVSISDSEEESNDTSYILNQKDIYADRPIPYIIGSDEWHKKWHVGLIDTPSDSESEKEAEDEYSESSSEDELPKDIYIKGSETSSEFDYSGRQSQTNIPVANSTFFDPDAPKQVVEVVHSDDSEGKNSIPAKTPLSNETFAEQLTAKLGNVVNTKNDEIRVNRAPMKPAQTTNKYMGNLFSDEPPPLDEDTLPQRNERAGLFSGGTGLFDDDNEDDLFWGQNKPPKQKDENRNSVPSDVDKNKNNVVPPKAASTNQNAIRAQVMKGLFDSDESSEEDIFAAPKKQTNNNPYKQFYEQKTTPIVPLFDEEPPEIEPVPSKRIVEDSTKKDKQTKTIPPLFSDDENNVQKENIISEASQKKKPIGGVSIFGNTDIFSSKNIPQKIEPNQNQNDAISEDISKPVPSQRQSKITQKEPEKVSLFDDHDTIVNSSPEIQKIDDKKVPKKISLFDDDTLFDDDDIFKNIVQSDKTKSDSNVEKNKENKDTLSIFGNEQKNVDNITDKFKKNVSLFDSDLSDNESLFDNKHNVKKRSTNNDSLFNNKIIEQPAKKLEQENKKSQIIEETKASLFEESTEENVENINKQSEFYSTKVDLFEDPLSYDEPDELIFKKDSNEKEIKNDILKDIESFKDTPKLEEATFDNKKEIVENKDEVQSEPSEKNNVSSLTENMLSNDLFTKPPEEPQLNSQVVIPPICLFDSTPPPDDDWETKSDSSESNNDINDDFSYHEVLGAQRSSLFDMEPPSLRPDESSGIVRDHQNTRVEGISDDSSFFPYASSSRRLSSDIFGEDQSGDNFFVTKNKTENQPQPNLQSIPEMGDGDFSQTKIDITPSGDINDFVSSDSVFEKSEIKEAQNITIPSKKNVSLFDSDNESNDTDELFGNIKNKIDTKLEEEQPHNDENILAKEEEIETPKIVKIASISERFKNMKQVEAPTTEKPTEAENNTVPPRKNVSLFDSDNESNDADDLFDNIKNKVDTKLEENQLHSDENILEKEQETETPKIGKIASISERLKNMQVEAPISEKPTVSPGKLKHNLNINVNALIPGAMPKPRNVTLEGESEKLTDSNVISKSNGAISPEISKNSHQEKPIDFENDSLEKVEVLHSITKDRARVPLKRRPSTRKGRKEALRISGIDFDLNNEKNDNNETNNESSKSEEKKLVQDAENMEENKGISMVFGQKEQIENEEFKNLEQNKPDLFDETPTEKLSDISLFKDDKTDNIDNNLFQNDSQISAQKQSLKDDTFTKSNQENVDKISKDIPSKENTQILKKSSIFDDEDDDDLFQATTVKKSSNLKVVESSSIFSDDVDSEDDLFGTKKEQNLPNVNKKEKDIKKFKESSKKVSLFDDNSSDDDLFASNNKEKAQSGTSLSQPVTQKLPKKSIIKKLENKETDEDPLSALLK